MLYDVLYVFGLEVFEDFAVVVLEGVDDGLFVGEVEPAL